MALSKLPTVFDVLLAPAECMCIHGLIFKVHLDPWQWAAYQRRQFKEWQRSLRSCSSTLLFFLRGKLGSGLQHFPFLWLQQLPSWWRSYFRPPFIPKGICFISGPLSYPRKWNLIISCNSFPYLIIPPDFLASVANCSLPLKSILSYLDTHALLEPQLESTFPSLSCDYVFIWLNSYQWNEPKWYVLLLERKLLHWPSSSFIPRTETWRWPWSSFNHAYKVHACETTRKKGSKLWMISWSQATIFLKQLRLLIESEIFSVFFKQLQF